MVYHPCKRIVLLVTYREPLKIHPCLSGFYECRLISQTQAGYGRDMTLEELLDAKVLLETRYLKEWLGHASVLPTV